ERAGWAERHIFARRGLVRDGDGEEGVPWQQRTKCGERDLGEGTRGGYYDQTADATGARSRDSPLPGERSRGTLADSEGPGIGVEVDHRKWSPGHAIFGHYNTRHSSTYDEGPDMGNGVSSPSSSRRNRRLGDETRTATARKPRRDYTTAGPAPHGAR